MPLLLPTLTAELTKIMDSNSPNFVGFPNSNIEVANNWSAAIFNYAQNIIPVSTTALAAKSSFIGVLQGVGAPNSFFPLLQTALNSFAVQLALGMLPTYNGVAPVVPCNFAAAINLGVATSIPNSTRINTFASIIDTWFRTGTSTLVASPFTPLNWN